MDLEFVFASGLYLSLVMCESMKFVKQSHCIIGTTLSSKMKVFGHPILIKCVLIHIFLFYFYMVKTEEARLCEGREIAESFAKQIEDHKQLNYIGI